MRKRSYTKVIALVSIVAIFSLTAPGLFASETYRGIFSFDNFLRAPGVFLYSFLYFTPIYDIGKVVSSPAVKNSNAKQIKILGLLDSVRPADED